MKRGMRRFTVEWIRSGQPRPYADTEKEIILFVEWVAVDGGEFVPNPEYSSQFVKDVARGIMGGFIDSADSVHGFEPILQQYKNLGEGRHSFFVTLAFTG